MAYNGGDLYYGDSNNNYTTRQDASPDKMSDGLLQLLRLLLGRVSDGPQGAATSSGSYGGNDHLPGPPPPSTAQTGAAGATPPRPLDRLGSHMAMLIRSMKPINGVPFM